MARSVIGLFDTFSDAQNVVQELVQSGFRREDISLIARDGHGEVMQHSDGTGDGGTAEGAGAGAVGGTVVGGAIGFLVGAGLLAIPGIGPVLAAGPLAAAIGTVAAATGAGALGAGIGAATGGLMGGLIGAGVPEDDARVYSEGVRRGGTLVTVAADDSSADSAQAVMRRFGVVDIERRGAEWRESGWNPAAAQSNAAERETAGVGDNRRENSEVATTDGAMSAAVAGVSLGTIGGPVGDVAGERNEHTMDSNTYGSAQGERTLATDIDTDTGRSDRGAGVRVHNANEYSRPAEFIDSGERSEPTDEFTASASPNNTPGPDFARGERQLDEVGPSSDFARGMRSEPEDNAGPDFARGERQGNETSPGPDFARGMRSFDQHDSDFRTHYESTGSSQTYDRHSPAYRFGYDYAATPANDGMNWDLVEANARRDWERDNPNSWEEFKDAIRYAWEKARGLR